MIILENLKLVESLLKDALTFYQRSKQDAKIISQFEKDIKSEMDLILNDQLLTSIKKHSPLPVLSEESESETPNGDFWVIDPLDGTFNFHKGIPFFGTSIALIKNGLPHLGGVVNFANGDIYLGCTDGVSTKNGESLIVPTQAMEVNQAALATGFPLAFDWSKDHTSYMRTLSKFKKVRMLGSAAISLCLCAEGVVDVYWEKNIRLWDIAGGFCVLKGMGGNILIQQYKNDTTLEVVAIHPNIKKDDVLKTMGPM